MTRGPIQPLYALRSRSQEGRWWDGRGHGKVPKLYPTEKGVEAALGKSHFYRMSDHFEPVAIVIVILHSVA